jgi:aminoglycoside phosphotransferase (APT) family kinase protein
VEGGGPGAYERSRGPRRVAITPGQVAAIGRAHGIAGTRFEPLESIGIINSIYLFGDHAVLRVPRDHPGHVRQVLREAVAIPAAVAAGVHTAGVLAFDDSLEILPVPFLVVERVDGVDLESRESVPPDPHATWRRLGEDLARIHLCRTEPPPGEPWPEERRDPRVLVDLCAEQGWLSPLEARRFHGWLDRLAPLVTPFPEVFIHGDMQMANVLVDPDSLEYRALIDWGGARRGHPAEDFSVVPMAAVAPMLEGYRDLAGPHAVVDEASMLWRRLQLVLGLLPRGSARECAWAERPVGRLTDLLLHFQRPRPGVWEDLAP